MKRKYCLATAVILMILSVCTVYANESLLVTIKSPACPWADVNLSQKLDYYLSARTDLSVDIKKVDRHNKDKYDDLHSLSKMVGESYGYLIEIDIDRIDLERRKTVLMPFILNRFRVFAVMSGSLRVFDVQNERLLEWKDLKYSIKARDRWQFLEDNAEDPGLLIPVDAKSLLFNKLEDKSASELFSEINNIVVGTSIENK